MSSFFIHRFLNNPNTLGIIYMLISCCSYALMYCLIRLIGESLSPMVLLFYRNFLSLLLIWPFAASSFGSFNVFRSFTRQNLIRGLLGFTTMSLLTTALSYGVVTEIVALGFLTPIWTCMLAVLILSERITLNKGIALFAGIIGCYIIIQPQHREVDIWLIIALVTTFTWAFALVIVKQLLSRQTAPIIVFHLSWMTFALATPWMLNSNYWPNWQQWCIMLIMAVLSNLSQFLMTKAYSVADVTVVMPFDFSKLIFTAIIAYIMFGEVLQLNTVAGAIIILAGGYLVFREARKGGDA